MFLSMLIDTIANRLSAPEAETPGAGGGAAPPASPPAAPPAAPSTPPVAGSARKNFLEKAAALKPSSEGIKPKGGEAPAKPTGEAPADPAAPADGGDKPLTPEEEAIVNSALSEYDSDFATKALHDAWKSGTTPDTDAWLKEQRAKLQERIQKGKNIPAASPSTDPAQNTPGTTPAGAEVEFQAVVVPPAYRAITEADKTERHEPKMLDTSWLREQGIDPDRVPAKYAKALGELMRLHNQQAATGSYLFKEFKGLVTKRESLKDQLFQTEFTGALKEAGYAVTDTVSALMSEARKATFVNGVKQPLSGVIKKMVEKHPAVFTKGVPTIPAGGAAPEDGGQAAPQVTPAAPEPPQGTRTRAVTQNTPAPSTPRPKTINDARKSFAEAFAKDLNKG